MTKYRVSFEIESDEQWEPMASRKYGTVKVLGDKPLIFHSLTIPVDAVVEEIPEPFEAGYYGCYDTTSGELNWLKPFNSAEDLAWSRKWMLKTQEIVPVSISRAQKCQVAAPEPELAGQKFQVGDIVRVKHAFAYNPHAGKTGKIVHYDPAWVGGTYRVQFQDTGTVNYFDAGRLELLDRTIATYVGTLEGFSVGDYVKVKGNTGVGIVAAINPLHKTRPIHVDIKFSGKFQYAPNQLEHSTATAYEKSSKED